MTGPIYVERLVEPLRTAVLVSVPHAGTVVPAEIDAGFATDYIRTLPMTDWFLDRIYDFLPGLGIDTIIATHSRFVADLNRPPVPVELYPGRFETGLVATTTFNGEDIYERPPDEREIERRRVSYHAPYHARLRELLDAKTTRFGHALLVDAHSVASRASLVHEALTREIYLGDRDGRSCDPLISDTVHGVFEDAGFAVVRNDPYKGGYITDHYGEPPRVQAIQIEMVQRLYMNEDAPGESVKPHAERLVTTLKALFQKLLTAVHG